MRAPAVSAIAQAPTEAAEAEDTPLLDEAPLSVPQRVVRALTFWSKVVPILAAYKAVEVRADYVDEPEAETEKKYEQLHDWGSDRLQGAINELKGFYVKCACAREQAPSPAVPARVAQHHRRGQRSPHPGSLRRALAPFALTAQDGPGDLYARRPLSGAVHVETGVATGRPRSDACRAGQGRRRSRAATG